MTPIMRLTIPQYRALEAVQRGQVLRSALGDAFIAPGIRQLALWVLFTNRLIADGPKVAGGSELTKMVLTESGRLMLERLAKHDDH